MLGADGACANYQIFLPVRWFWNLFFKGGALERFTTPLQCNFEEYSKDSMIRRSDPWLLSSFAKEVCRQLLPSAKVHAGERTLFTRGMSVSDLMGAYIASKQHSSCLHSDWAVGYFVNFYNISRHTPIGDGDWYHEFDTQTPHGRIFDLDGSLVYKKVLNYCRNNGAEAVSYTHLTLPTTAIV